MCGQSLLWYGTVVPGGYIAWPCAAAAMPCTSCLCMVRTTNCWCISFIVGRGSKNSWPSLFWVSAVPSGQISESRMALMCCLECCAQWKLSYSTFEGFTPFFLLSGECYYLHPLCMIWAGFCSSNHSFKGKILITLLWLNLSLLQLMPVYCKSLSTPRTNLSAYFFILKRVLIISARLTTFRIRFSS